MYRIWLWNYILYKCTSLFIDREDIPIEFIKAIYKYTLDVEDKEGIIGKGGTSRNHAERLARFFVRYANTNEKINKTA